MTWQPHAIDVADIDGDRLEDIIVGKRRWTHGANKDIEFGAAPVLYRFQLKRPPFGVHFRPHLVDDWSGVGVQVVVVDVTGDFIPDVLTASKLGSILCVTKRARLPNRPQCSSWWPSRTGRLRVGPDALSPE